MGMIKLKQFQIPNLEGRVNEIDLHTHTTASGYGKTPVEVLTKMEETKLVGGAITDHHSVAGLQEIVENKEKRKIFSGAIVPGIEIGALCQGTQIDILGYGVDYKKMGENKKVAGQRRTLSQVDELFTNELNEVLKKYGIHVDSNESLGVAGGILNTAFTQLVKNHADFLNKIDPSLAMKDRSNFVGQVLNNSQHPLKLDLSNFRMPAETVIDIIKECNGKAILAHPPLYREKSQQIIDHLIKKVDGIEVFHPSANEQQKKHIHNICKQNGKLITGGSDYRSDENESDVGQLGCEKVPAKLLYQFEDKLI